MAITEGLILGLAGGALGCTAAWMGTQAPAARIALGRDAGLRDRDAESEYRRRHTHRRGDRCTQRIYPGGGGNPRRHFVYAPSGEPQVMRRGCTVLIMDSAGNLTDHRTGEKRSDEAKDQSRIQP